MPPVSEKQRRAMYAAKEGHSTLGIPQSVGAEFVAADSGGKLPKRIKAPSRPHRPARPAGSVIDKAAGSSMPRKPKYGAGHYMSTFGSIGPGEDDAA